MTKWAGLSDMYVLIRSDYRYYLGIHYLATYPVLHGWDGNTARRSESRYVDTYKGCNIRWLGTPW